MTHTLWSHDMLLGSAELAPLPGAPGGLSGAFTPEPTFDEVWPVLRALLEATAAVTSLFEPMSEELSGEEFGQRLVGAPEEAAAIVAAREAVLALGLTVRDEHGRAFERVQPLVNTVIPMAPGLSEHERELLMRGIEAAVSESRLPRYLLVVTPLPGTPSR